MDTKSSNNVVASGVLTITGTAAQIAAVQAAAGITKPADWIAQPTAGTAAATDLMAIDLNNSTAVDASLITTITGTAADIATVVGASGITKPTTWTATVTGTTNSVANLNTIDGAAGSGVITGTLTSGILASFSTLTGTGNAYTITINDTGGAALNATDLSALGAKTDGVVTVSNAVAISGTAAQVSAALVTANTLVVAATATVALSDTTAAAVDVNAIDTKTSGLITLGSLATVTGAVSDLLIFSAAEQASTGIAAITNYAVTASNATITAANLNTLDGSNGNSVITTTNGGGWTITALSGATVAGTGSIDKFVFLTSDTGVTISSFKTAGADIAQLGGTNAVVAGTVLLPGSDVINRVIIDTAANLGSNAVSIGNLSANTNDVRWAVASDTGAIYYDADGNWTVGVVIVGTLGVAVVAGDLLVG